MLCSDHTTRKINFEDLKSLLLYRKIIKWDCNKIVLDNGVEIKIEETDHDCCAMAGGKFENVTLDAAITKIEEIEYSPWEDDDTYGCSARVVFLHNKNVVCAAEADADAGNGGYYYSVASFVVTVPQESETLVCHFVSETGEEGA